MRKYAVAPFWPLWLLALIGCGDPGSSSITDLGLPADQGTSPDLIPSGPPTVILPKQAFTADDLAVLVNLDDPQSVAVGEHYRVARRIPDANMIKLKLGAGLGVNVSAGTFATWKAQIDQATPKTVQGFAVTWIQPSVVDCMSLTSALAFGFDKKFCNTSGKACGVTADSAYYSSDERAPFTNLNIRPAMILAGATAMEANALIDRGVAADNTFPTGDGYLLVTTDKARSSRQGEFQTAYMDWQPHPEELALNYIDNSTGKASDFIANKTNVLFYFTGLVSVPMLDTNMYRPGAIADHLTSFGGQIPTSGQMSILKWTEGGATASYGTVVEPCNFVQKFPDPTVVVPTYFHGATLMEAYWQSVAWPGEGLFIGEPLAKPWGTVATWKAGTLTITTTAMEVGTNYKVQSAQAEGGPWTDVMTTQVDYNRKATLTVMNAAAPFYRFQ